MNLKEILLIIERIVAVMGVLVIAWGSLHALYRFLFQWKQKNLLNLIRYDFGHMITLGLEFIVAADVIETITAPDYYSVGILASLIGIRTLLAYFMNKEFNSIKVEVKKKK